MSERPTLTSLANTHLALVASAALILLSVIRIYCFVGFDTTAALSVLAVANRTHVLTSTLLTLLLATCPLVITLGPVREWLNAGHATGAGFGLQLRTALIVLPFGPIVFSTLNIAMLVTIVAAFTTVWLIRRRRRKRATKSGSALTRPPSGTYHWLFATSLGLLLMTALFTPWLARESISVSSTPEPVVGYVVGEQAGKLLIFEKSQKVTWVDSDAVEKRAVCAAEGSFWFRTGSSLRDRGGVDCS